MDETVQINISAQSADRNTLSESHMKLFGRNIGMTKDQLIALVTLSLGIFYCWAYFSMFAPFFPAVATQKNLNSTEIGITFGIIPFVLLIFSPFFGKYVSMHMRFIVTYLTLNIYFNW